MSKTLLAKLIKLKLITPGGICQLARCFLSEGFTLMALLRFSAHYYPHRYALVTESERYTYQELYAHARRLAATLYTEYGLKRGMCVGLMCRNRLLTALLLPALSRLGVKVKLMSTDIAPGKINDRIERSRIDLLLSDNNPPRPSHEAKALPRVWRGGEISVCTGGSGGHYKEAPRGMRIGQFLPPFFALLEAVRIDEYDSLLMPLPLYHGFGLATFIVSLLIGKQVHLMQHFDAGEALKRISGEQIEVLPLVPAMLARLWQTEGAAREMRSVKCIICGGDRLDRKWIDCTNAHLGPVLYNLYGTSEAGFFMLAMPEALLRHKEVTIGRPIRGVKCRVEDIGADRAGTLWVRSGWAMSSRKGQWQSTGDRVYCDSEGYYFHRGRTDNMVVCGGENVYPEHVEEVINAHPDVLRSLVFPAPSPRFGTVLHARIELHPAASPDAEALRTWLRPRLSRAEMPHEIILGAVSVLHTGKMARREGQQASH